jgi:hypothetical protein
MPLLRTCLFGYGFATVAGLAVAIWLSLVAGFLVAWLGGGILSILWSLWSYRRHGVLVDPSDTPSL